MLSRAAQAAVIDAISRADRLSDVAIRSLAARMESSPAGQRAFQAASGAAVPIFLVLPVTDLIGPTDLFPFVKAGRVTL